MSKTRLLAVLAAVFVIVSFSCKKSEKAESMEIPSEGVQIKFQGAETAPAIPLLFKLDGKAEDWAGIEPLWAEGGAAGLPFNDDSFIDIKQVYFKNDAQYLYVFMRISPTIEERFRKHRAGGYIGYLFFDTDNNPQTGKVPVEGFEPEYYKGNEIMVDIPVGVLTDSGQSFPTVSYGIYNHEDGFREVKHADSQDSLGEGSLIAHGPDGVEFALKLGAMKLTPPMTFRAMLHEFGSNAQSVGKLMLEAAK
ncbi:MAG: hypothetical protein WAU81_00765 [Candidatus Aminicenantales bacterium]